MSIDPQAVIMMLHYSHNEVERGLKALDHAQSVRQLPFEANCLNWIMGHVMAYRCKMLSLLNEPIPWTEAEIARYAYGSAPVLNAEDCLPYERIVADFEAAGATVLARLEGLTAADLDAPTTDPNFPTLGLLLLRWGRHEVYHIGQCDILRAYVSG